MLVQGTARSTTTTSRRTRERYIRESVEKLPATKSKHPPEFVAGDFLSWYYTRLYIYVRPERVFVWPGGDFSEEPTLYGAHMEEVRTHHSAEPEVPLPAPEGGSPVWDDRMDELGRRHRTAVLSVVGPDGFPLSSRVAIEPDRGAEPGAPG